jgi:hypothetical protein
VAGHPAAAAVALAKTDGQGVIKMIDRYLSRAWPLRSVWVSRGWGGYGCELSPRGVLGRANTTRY